jgi:uncharacterized membrane protein YbhN (UPF0104 family)
MKRVYVIAGAAITLLAAFYFARTAQQHWASIRALEFTARMGWTMVLAAVLLALTYGVTARTWQLALRYLGARLALVTAIGIVLVSQFAKYLPGNVGHHVGRVLLAKRAGLHSPVVVGSILLDSLMVVLAAAVCSLPCVSLLWQLGYQHVVMPRWLPWLVLALLLAVLAAAWLSRARLLGGNSVGAQIKALIHRDRIGLLAQSVLTYCVSFALGGLALYLLLDTLSPVGLAALPLVIGVYTSAWLLGFLIPGAPAGLGVREACLLLGLGPLVGHDNALIAAALLRISTTLMDAVVLGIGAWMLRRQPH